MSLVKKGLDILPYLLSLISRKVLKHFLHSIRLLFRSLLRMRLPFLCTPKYYGLLTFRLFDSRINTYLVNTIDYRDRLFLFCKKFLMQSRTLISMLFDIMLFCFCKRQVQIRGVEFRFVFLYSRYFTLRLLSSSIMKKVSKSNKYQFFGVDELLFFFQSVGT